MQIIDLKAVQDEIKAKISFYEDCCAIKTEKIQGIIEGLKKALKIIWKYE